MGKDKKNRSSRIKKVVISLGIVITVSLAVTVYSFYKKVFYPNVILNSSNSTYIFIPTNSSFEDVKLILQSENILINEASFRWVSDQMNYTNKVLPGRYEIQQSMSNRELILLLRSGRQTPINVTFNNIRTIDKLASVISVQLEADSAALIGLLSNDSFLSEYDLSSETALSLFIPNTYEFYWNTSARQFVERMAEEYKDFWNETRLQQSIKIGLKPTEVSVLASIVEQETSKNDEKALIAGVYMNRYHKGWKLEADPTLIFAAGDFSIQRVLNVHKEINSPYNTYMYSGFPPGPICMPSIKSLDAVLNYEQHNYMFFCARDDFSGYHAFARTYSQHLVNARKFQRELNRRNIRS